ncbi:MAG: hypothetical protein HY097_01355 [Nitrospinae bacterium]|nr:hypothetical protein [Nitrospinota bacterium]
MRKVIITFFLVVCITGSAYAELTKKDIEEIRSIMREELQHVDKRFEQIDKRFEELREDMNKRFEQVDKRFEQMMSFMWILSTVFIGIAAVTIGFALWDRRTMIRPFESKTKEIENKIKEIGEMEGARLKNLISAFRELAKIDSNVAEILKKFNLF